MASLIQVSLRKHIISDVIMCCTIAENHSVKQVHTRKGASGEVKLLSACVKAIDSHISVVA